VTRRFFALIGAAGLVGCGGGLDPYAPAGTGSEPVPVQSGESGKSPGRALSQTADRAAQPGAGLLDVSTAADLGSYFVAVHAVVRDARGVVVGGADSELAEVRGHADGGLSLVLPAGEGYTLSLRATTADAEPTTCTASVGPLSIEAAATASLQVFAWRCGDVTGYVPSALNDDYPWLADWIFVARTSAAVGELIRLGAAGHDAAGNPAQFAWSADAAADGAFAEPDAASTSFRCQAARDQIPLTVSISDGEHTKRVTQTVACF
jgi:hypothetical protein